MHAVDFDVAAFSEWLAGQTGASADLTIEALQGGASCEIFRMTRLSQDWIIRRAPRSAVSATAHNVVREYQIIEALGASDVPVPEVLIASSDPAILGAPFFIMKFVDGEVFRSSLPESYLGNPQTHARVGEELIDRLADLHAFDWRQSKIAELARPENFLERQVTRWLGQLEKYRCRDLSGVDDVGSWLERHRPPSGDLTVMHGDYKLDNVIFSRDLPPRILSMLDFEMTTVGDPLIDLAWAMIFWPDEDSEMGFLKPGTEGGLDPRYCQTSQDLMARYSERTGRSIEHIRWYQAFSAWKLGIVLEGSYAKFLKGGSNNPYHQEMGHRVDMLLARAQRFAA